MRRRKDKPVLPDAEDRPLSLRSWGEMPSDGTAGTMASAAIVDCGWGRLIFGQTFATPHDIAEALDREREGKRDVALYVRDPHVVLAAAPQALFLDPSHTFRLELAGWERGEAPPAGLVVRRATEPDEAAINRLYLTHGMVPLGEGYLAGLDAQGPVSVLVATQDDAERTVVGVVMGVDHRVAFRDPDNGASLWALAVDPQAPTPGVGVALVTALAVRFQAAGRAFMDLSVMHDNREAIALYDKLGFVRIPVYCVKRKNPINEKLFLGPQPETRLNVYAQIVVDEARRRGIAIEIEDAEAGLFRLSLGGRAISCRESLSDLTSAVALSRCDDKRLTRRLLARAGLGVPDQIPADDEARIEAFLARHGRVVVKPARGEAGHGVAVDLGTLDEVRRAIARAREHADEVILEAHVAGEDLRIVVIDGAVIAAAIRRPPSIRGDGSHTVADLIDKQSRRRAAATDGESRIPIDAETERCVHAAGRRMDEVLAEGETLVVRKTANLHTGGTIHDVTGELHPDLAEAAIKGAAALDIPVVGFDFIVSDPAMPGYAIIEANERPGLANHEPQPTVERFVDFLFPQTKPDARAPGAGTGAGK